MHPERPDEPEPDKVAAAVPATSDAANGNGNDEDGDGNGGGAARPAVAPRLGKPRSTPTAVAAIPTSKDVRRHARARTQRGLAAAAQVQSLPEQPRRVDQPQGRLLLQRACPAAPSRRHRAAPAAATPTTSVRGCAAGAIPAAPSTSDSCKGCLAWGVYPATTGPAGRAAGGRATTRRAPAPTAAAPATSATDKPVACASRTPDSNRNPAEPPDVAAANQHSQQLFFANMVFKRRVTPLPDHVTLGRPVVEEEQEPAALLTRHQLRRPRLEQLTLFDMDPDPEVLRQRILVEDSELTRYCAAIVADHARRYGWSVRQRNAVIQSLRMLQTLRPTPPRRSAPVTSWPCAATTAPSPPPSTSSQKPGS